MIATSLNSESEVRPLLITEEKVDSKAQPVNTLNKQTQTVDLPVKEPTQRQKLKRKNTLDKSVNEAERPRKVRQKISDESGAETFMTRQNTNMTIADQGLARLFIQKEDKKEKKSKKKVKNKETKKAVF